MISKEIINNLSDAIINYARNSENFANYVSEAEDLHEQPTTFFSKLFEDGLESEFNSENELNTKKILGAALLIAKKKGVLPEGIPTDITSLDSASIVDETINKIKVSYQEAIGKIDIYEAADRLIDKATARATTLCEKAVSFGIDFGINKIATFVATAFPPAIPVVICIKQFQPFLTQSAQNLVKKGIGALNELAKKTVRKIGNFITTKVKSTIKSLLKA